MSTDWIETIERRLRDLEDRAAIAGLTATYSLAVNQGWAGTTVDLAALLGVFAPDAV